MLDISLFVPGLFDAEIDLAEDGPGGLPTLELLLARGRKTAASDRSHYAALCHLFGDTPADDTDIPVAAIGRLIDDDKRPEGYWMRADPVHLHAGQKSLSLLDSSRFPLTQHDALALAACVRQSFSDLGWVLEVPVPTRWYVQMDRRPSIRTAEIYEVAGRDIQKYMPGGKDAGNWHRLMNEIQMQLHSADINQLRVERGELPVNSLWFWGTGALPELQQRRWSRVFSDDNTAMGLSMLSNTPCMPLPEMAEDIFSYDSENGDVLVVISGFQSTMTQSQQRRQQLEQFENNWCRLLLQKMREGKLRSLKIISRPWEFEIRKTSLMKFWKQAKTLDAYMG